MATMCLPWRSVLLVGLFVAIALADDNATATPLQEETQVVTKHLSNLDSYDMLGFLLVFIMSALCAGAGIGGGGILVPILILVNGFAIKTAMPLSSVCILGGALFHIFMNWNRRHPTADRHLIDWTFLALMQPMLVGGTIVGGFLNKIMPPWVLALKLVMILSGTAFRTFKNGMRQWYKESDARALQELKDNEEAGDEKDPLDAAFEKHLRDSGLEEDDLEGKEMPTDVSPELQQLLEEDRVLPSFKVGLTVVVTLGALALTLAKGTKEFNPFHIECGSQLYFLVTLLAIIYCAVCFYFTRQHVLEQNTARVAADWEFHEGDINWDEEKVGKYPLYGIIAGIISGMCGIGGAMINAPLMVELRYLPQVARTTGATTLLFTSATAVMVYLQLDLLNFEFAAPMFIIGFVGTAIGQTGFNHLMAIYKNDALIVFAMAGIIFASACLMTIEGLALFSNFSKHPHGLHGVCDAVPDGNVPIHMDSQTQVAASSFVLMVLVFGIMSYKFDTHDKSSVA